jgi:spermidine synthase
MQQTPRSLTPLFALTIFVSSFLLFLVQPLIAKQILPWFGGTAGVWTMCLVFFQCVLLAGYAYADGMTRAPQRVQAAVHTTLLIAAVLTLPIIANMAWKPTGNEDPSLRILLLLLATIGLPYFMVSTTGPLLQAWFARAHAQSAQLARVYRLFALSNAASLAALVAYPFLIEPALTVKQQAWVWSLGFVLFALLAVVSAWVTVRRTAAPVDGLVPPNPSELDADGDSADEDDAVIDNRPPTLTHYGLWLLLAMLGTVMLLVVSTHITQDVASIPFLWIVPLSLYLLSFILCFDSDHWYRRWLLWPALWAMLPLMAWALNSQATLKGVATSLAIFCGGLFAVCMFCHGELVRAKPAPRFLTRFYLCISLGGAIGGLLVGLGAPRVFADYWEFPIALVACASFASLIALRVKWFWALLATLPVGLTAYWGHAHYSRVLDDTVLLKRNFYGTLRVREMVSSSELSAMQRSLVHGIILHGKQLMATDARREPTSYYGRGSGAGLAIAHSNPLTQGPRHVGVIGLGVGTLATYGRTGDRYRFYDLNPQVAAVAVSQFTFLSESRAKVDIVLGDARLKLEKETPQQFDVLVVDAFSSDSIPVHLLTREALTVYLRHMKEDGVIAYHVSNRHLNLTPVVAQQAEHAGLKAILIDDNPPANDVHLSTSSYVLVAPQAYFDKRPEIAEKAANLTPVTGLRMWNDDYNNLFQVLK